jgi:predicted nucleotide-binding protein
MNSALENFRGRISNFDEMARRPSSLLPYLAEFIEEEREGAPATVKALEGLYEELRIRAPKNLYDAVRKSKFFVKARDGGYRLNHEGKLELSASLSPAGPSPKGTPRVGREEKTQYGAATPAEEPPNSDSASRPHNRDVMVIYGHDESLRRDLFSFLRDLGLNPLEFEEMRHLTGEPSPFMLDIVRTGFQNAQACVALFSPDEVVRLREELETEDDPKKEEFQPRPNVLIEAGMAIALQPKRTILLHVGKVRDFSDLAGKNYVNLDGSPESRNKLLGRLREAGCDAKSHGSDWLTKGKFKPSGEHTK